MSRSLLLWIGVWIGLWFGSEAVRADETVTNLTHAALAAALAEGGFVSFEEEGTIVLTNTIRITNDVELDALGMDITLSGSNAFRIFEVASNVVFTVNGVRFTGGNGTNGGALYIRPDAVVELIDCVFASNAAEGKTGFDGMDGDDETGTGGNGTDAGPGRPGLGGAIYNAGELTVTTCQFLTNSALGGNGGNGGNGGSGTFQGGDGGDGGIAASGRGGAIYHVGTALTITDSTFEGNTCFGGLGGLGGTNGAGPFNGLPGGGGAGALAAGGAIYAINDFTIEKCTFAGNSGVGGDSAKAGTDSGENGDNGARGGDGTGGAVFSAGESELINCTFFANAVFGGTGGDGGPGRFTSGDGGNGGNAFGGNLYSTGIVSVINCTFSSGRAVGGTNGLAGAAPFPGSDGNPGRGRGVNVANAVGELTLINTLIATNTGGGNITNVSGTLIDGGHNISSDASFNFTGTSLKNTNPRLNPLADNGGPTRTMSLQTNSPAIDAASDTNAPATDQRGIARPVGAHSDIGAYESALAPVIQTQPQSQIKTNGASVTFSVGAVGEAPLRYYWRFNGTNIPSATGASYTIPSVSLSNAGTYAVLVSNRFGTTLSSNATLTILAAPVVTTQPTNLTVGVGGMATFTVGAAGSAPLSYQWRFNGTNLLAGATASSFTLTNVQTIQAGVYSVSVSNAVGGTISTGATLSVNGPPGITAQPFSQTALLGGSVTFSVTAVSPVPISYQWRFYGTNIPGAQGSSFSRSTVGLEHAGPYDVIVSNSFGTTISAVAMLTVDLPIFSGAVLEGTNPVAGVTIAIGTNQITTGADGRFSLSLFPGTYSAVPSKANYRFEPAMHVATLPPSTNVTFSALPAFTISGRVFDGENGLAGVTVSAETYTAVTGPDGSYTLQAAGPATYFVFASLAGYKFSPAQEVNVPPNASNVNFFVSNRVFTISGRVLEAGRGLAGVTFAEFASLMTDSEGFFSISDLIPDTYTFTPRKIGSTYGFSPSTRTVVLTTQDVTNVDFMAGSIISSIVKLTNGNVQLTVIGPVGTNRIEASTNLQDWEIIFSNRAGPFLFFDTQASNFPTRYYRSFQVK